MSIIVKEFKDSNNNTILPLAYNVGGVKCDLLWTNSSPTTAFSAQTISLDLSEYEWFIMTVNMFTSKAEYQNFVINRETNRISGFRSGSTSDMSLCSSRTISISDTGIVFGDGYSYNGTNTAACVPYKIYGIKLSYVVPTEVNGLQYVEVE